MKRVASRKIFRENFHRFPRAGPAADRDRDDRVGERYAAPQFPLVGVCFVFTRATLSP